MSDTRALAVLLTVSAVTIALRVLPYLAVRRLADSAYLRSLGDTMPVGVMVLLVVYTLEDVRVTEAPYGLPSAVALVVTVLLYARTQNALVGICAGLATYLVAVNVVV